MDLVASSAADWGLSQTVGSLGDVIKNLAISTDDIQAAFASLKTGLDAPLAGMGVSSQLSQER